MYASIFMSTKLAMYAFDFACSDDYHEIVASAPVYCLIDVWEMICWFVFA